jgi:hypothetical protein
MAKENLLDLLADALPCIDRAAAGCRTTKTLRDVAPSECNCVACDIDAALKANVADFEQSDEKVRTLHTNATDHMKCASRDCWLCHGVPESAGPQ